jgi:multiple sugar transport system permease protein
MKRPSLPYFLLIPIVIYLFLFLFFPFIFDIYFSGFHYNLQYPEMPFTGFANYEKLFSDPEWWTSLATTFQFTVVCIAFEFLLGLGLALFCARDFKGVGALRVIVLIPMMMIPAATGIMWKLMMYPGRSVIDLMLEAIGLPAVKWLGNSFWTPVAVVIMDVWQWAPFIAIILFAGLMGLPLEPFEAARVDGARPFFVFRKLTLPMLYPAISVALILRVLDLLKLFDQPFVLASGGSGTETVSFYIYRIGFRILDVGYGSTISVVFWILVWVLANILAWRIRRFYE